MKKIILLLIALSIVNSVYSQDQNSTAISKSDLTKANIISVTVGGSFIINGTFPAFITERADQFLTRIFTEAKSQVLTGAKDEKQMAKIKDEFENYAKRDILLKRFSGEMIKLDLEKFRLTGDFKFNPNLKNDDVIVFPAYDEERNFVDVTGAVNKPIKFQFVEGDKISDAILFAQGINKAYDNVSEAEISRLTEKGTKEEIINVKLSDDFVLQRGDRVRILFVENNKMDFKVLVLGEVNKPGEIAITKDNTNLRDVIVKAGGFTNDAWLEKAEQLKGTSKTQMLRMKLIKESYVKGERLNLLMSERYFNDPFLEQMKILRMNDLYSEDSLTIIIDNMLRVLQNNRTIDFTKVLMQGSDEGNSLVSDGDIIVIPKREELVYVFGQVTNPGYVSFKKEKDHNYYLTKAGGVGKNAQDDIKIIKGNSYAWFDASEKIPIDAGDFIYVPKDVPKPFEYYMKNIGTVAGIVGSIATIILLLIQFGK
ncbi:MAG: SLBB domain-containing protein [Ignavibacteriales bacterium]|nr:SLBB domain-containing protein [Ignavibacteriales bacterium]